MTSSPPAVEAGQWDRVIDYVNRELFDKPDEFYTLDKLRKAAAVDRRLTLREILEKIFGLIPRFKSRDELLEEEFSKFVADANRTRPKPSPHQDTSSRPTSPTATFAHIIDDATRLTELDTTSVLHHRRFQGGAARNTASSSQNTSRTTFR